MGTKIRWTEEELKILEEGYKNYVPIKELAKKLPDRTEASISSKALKLKLPEKYVRNNNPKFKAIYQDYDWCYDKYINKRMSFTEMAEEADCSKRVIEKWCSEIHKLNAHTIREYIHLTDLQKQVIMFGTLGDGHIDRRENQPLYIEVHAEDEKDYLFWKYDILKNLCNSEPTYYKEHYTKFGTEKEYLCKGSYRLCTKIIDDLFEIRSMSRLEKIQNLNEFGICLHILDDGSRNNLWQVCLAEWTQEEMDEYQKKCLENSLICKQNKDKRYYSFDAVSSKKIDEMILKYIPNDLDIVYKKILGNDKIKELCDYKYVIFEDGTKESLSKYCQSHSLQTKYDIFKNMYEADNVKQIPEKILLERIHIAS